MSLPLIGLIAFAGTASWQPVAPGDAGVRTQEWSWTLTNRALTLKGNWGAKPSLRLENHWARQTIASPAEPFELTLRSGQVLRASAMRHGILRVEAVPARRRKAVSLDLDDPATGLHAHWEAILRDDANYVRERLTLTPTRQDMDVAQVKLLDLKAPGARVAGTVLGSPVVAGQEFFGLEHPMSVSHADANGFQCAMPRKLPLKAGQSTVYSAVLGAAPRGQVRRAFLAYVEKERARPYQPFLHYNSWYDIGYGHPYDDAECVQAIHAVGAQLAQKRGVKLSSFLFDDGWDDTSTVWEFNKGFPHGFAPLKEAAAEYGAGPGIWLSPWGGYSEARQQRLETGAKAGMEIDSQGYALSGPKYYARFHDVCMQMVKQYGVNQFKFDGTGSPDKQYPGSAFGSDFEAAIALIRDLRKAQPKLFVNLTTGTWPSPFWTRYADSVWRGGADHSFAGVGTERQRWMTYRDGLTYSGVVRRGPLYPLNSLMLHGVLYGRYADGLTTDPGHDFRSEVRSYFGSGTQLQELYITPGLLSAQNWDDLAESAKWAAANADVLVDTHWVGGDPIKLEVYGWASWTPRKAILVLRNPSASAQSFSVDPQRVFELPEGYRGTFEAHSPYASDRQEPSLTLEVGKSKVVELKPFEVRVLEATPR